MSSLRTTLPVLHLHCAACAKAVEDAIRSLPGVVGVAVNLAAASATIEYLPEKISLPRIRKAVQAKGYDLLIEETGSLEAAERIKDDERRKLKDRTITAIALSLPSVIISMFFMDIPFANEWMWAFATPVVFGLGKDFFIRAGRQLRRGVASMDTLVALSTGVAYLFSVFSLLFPDFWLARGIRPHVYFETASVIIAFILLGRWLEERAKGSTSSSIKKLMGLRPKTVTLARTDGQLVQVGVEQVAAGDIVLVKPGEKIAVDGAVTEGASYVDESMISGEPVPVLKQKHEKVYAGTINQKGSFRFRAEKVGAETLLAHIIRMVQDAQGSKAPVQKLVDKVAGVFVPAVVGVALAALAVWLLVGGVGELSHGLLAFVTVLIIACPCALGLATPTAIMVGIGRAAEQGILIKDAESLETARKISAVVLDKTGVITEGRPTVAAAWWATGDSDSNSRQAAILRSLEVQSEHPLAEAVAQRFADKPLCAVAAFENFAGKGVKGTVDGQTYFAGSARLLADNRIAVDERLADMAKTVAAQAKTAVWFADEKRTLALIAIDDKVKEASRAAVRQLRCAGIAVYLLTGDNAATAKEVAGATDIHDFCAEALPQQKADFIRRLQGEGRVVAMVGDGVNDSAALAQADVSIAMGKGSDVAIDVAGMTIVSSDLSKIPAAIQLSKQTVSVIRQNLFWAFAYNLTAVPVAAGALYAFNGFLLNPMIAGGAMALSSLSVVCNSLRLLGSIRTTPLSPSTKRKWLRERTFGEENYKFCR
ncbi:MAG: heavy metal translocating P-type ATPase [Prevotellaceae bacterium]|nr:heavy metal translocating P-type ATPase [Prevotellaceae bacterium]